MDAEKLNQELYDKMAAEQKEYRSWLLEQTPEEILNHVFDTPPVRIFCWKCRPWRSPNNRRRRC